jgi:indolepyruvate ferredoxin oxidoreductase alpha subunit
MVYPLPEKLIKDFAQKVDKIYVIEELEPFIENHVRKIGIPAVGKVQFPIIGEITSQLIKEVVLGENGAKLDEGI